MDDENVNPGDCRTPTLADLVALCRRLNEQGARYMVVGGFAIIQHGYMRTTGDIDILLDGALDNQQLVRRAMESLPEKAILELGPDKEDRIFLHHKIAEEEGRA